MTGISGIGLSGGNSALDFQAVAYSADKDAGIVVLIADIEILRYILARNIFYIEIDWKNLFYLIFYYFKGN